MDMQLGGRVAIVTGGSRGIGRAIASALAWEGVTVALVGRDEAAAVSAAAAIASETGRPAAGYRGDAGNDAEVRAVVAQILAEHGRIDILVNCAAQPAGQGPVPGIADMTAEDLWSEINVKVMGYLRFAREVVPAMRQRRFGRIINIGGLAARRSGSFIGTARNMGVVALTKNLADEVGPDGINVTCVHPGYTRTEKTPDAIRYQAATNGLSLEAAEQRLIDTTAIRRLVTAEEVADVVTFLASPRSAAITGDVIAAGGGQPGALYT